MISFIVSVYDRVEMLNACLATLAVQDVDKEIIVCGNHMDEDILIACGLVADEYGAIFKPTGRLGAKSCYESADMVAERALGEWLCFPSDDSLYVKHFSRIMLETAWSESADVVYCDCIYRQDANMGPWSYSVLDTHPRIGAIDKTCFIVKRELFKVFPPHPRGWQDGALIEQLIRDGARHAKAPGCLVVHQ